MFVYVINQNGHPLMPCKPSKARKLLQARKAKVTQRSPFTIQLLGTAKSTFRKSCWVSIVEEVIRVVKQIPLPTGRIVIEDVQVDIARLNNPTLSGSQYQDPTRLDENLRIACLMCDGYSCQQCGKQKRRLEAHHLVFRANGGKDALTNLLTLCEGCHHHLHEGKITLKVTGVSGHFDQIAQRTMQGKSHLYATLGAHTPLSTLFGYQIAFRPRRTRRQYHDLPRKGQGRVRYQVNDALDGFRKGDVVKVKGTFMTPGPDKWGADFKRRNYEMCHVQAGRDPTWHAYYDAGTQCNNRGLQECSG